MQATDVPSGRDWVIAQTAPWRARLQALATRSRLAPENADFLHAAGQALAAQGRHSDALNCFAFLVAASGAIMIARGEAMTNDWCLDDTVSILLEA